MVTIVGTAVGLPGPSSRIRKGDEIPARRRSIPLHHVDPAKVRRLWQILWGLGVAMILMLLFATMAERPFAPEALHHFPAELLQTGRRFAREARLAGSIHGLLSLGFMLAFCFSAVGARLLRWLEAQGRGRLWLSVITVAVGISLIAELIGLPFAYYLGYLHEHAYGLSQETPGAWLGDHLLGLAIGMGTSLLLWISLYWMIRRWPRNWWVPASLMQIGFSAVMLLLYPILVMPIFNEMVPVEDPQTVRMVQHLADRAGVEVGTVRQMIVSDQTSRVNAMVTGIGPTKQVIFYDTLLQQFTPQEVEVVMAHEMAHAIHRDVAFNWMVAAGLQVALMMAAAWMLRGMVGVGPLRLPAPHAARGLALLILFMGLVGQLSSPAFNVLSRQMEVRADRFALELTGNPQAFIASFKKLAGGNPGDVDPPVLVEFLSHSHPSIIKRIRLAEQFVPR